MVATTNANESVTRSIMNRDMKKQNCTIAGSANNPSGSQVRNNELKQGNTARGNNSKTNDRTSYSFGKGFDKDDDDFDNRSTKGSRASDRTKSSQAKDMEPQLDKLETLRRLEREKKVKEKKNRDELYENYDKPKRPQMKTKRMPRKDWTKSYLNGLIDEDEDYYM